jgi:hypothetical protein
MVAQFGSDVSIINLTPLLNQLAFPQTTAVSLPPALSVSVAFNPFNGQKVLVMTDQNGVVTVFPPGEAITLFGVETVSGRQGSGNSFFPIPRFGALGPMLSQTASVAFPGPDANGLVLLNVDQMGNLLLTVFQNGMTLGPFNLGSAPLGRPVELYPATGPDQLVNGRVRSGATS